jgi:UTP--glucose-1-phosphate uridylyltransferase
MKVSKAVFPVAGLGTRFLPATKVQPKEMIPLVDRPAIQYVIEEVVASGLREVILITGRGKTAIEDHFDRSPELERLLESRGKDELLAEIRRIAELVEVCAVRQKEALGLGHAVLAALPSVGRQPFAVLLPDDIVDSKTPCLKQLLDVHERTGASVIAVERVEHERTRDYGVIDGTPEGDGVYRIQDLVEKPDPSEAPSDLAIIGRYILTPEIFDELQRTGADSGGEIQLTNALRTLRERQPVYALEFEGKRFDTGNKLGFLKATVEFALKREGLGEKFRDYLRTLDLKA